MTDHDLRALHGVQAYNLARSPGETRTARAIFSQLMIEARRAKRLTEIDLL